MQPMRRRERIARPACLATASKWTTSPRRACAADAIRSGNHARAETAIMAPNGSTRSCVDSVQRWHAAWKIPSAMKTSVELIPKLCAISRREAIDPHLAFDWPEALDKTQWFMSPELVTLHGTDLWETLREEERKVLSFYELTNFFSLVLAGERLLLQRMARLLQHPTYAEVTPYLHHFIDEENKHMVWFGTFCRKYARKIYPTRHYPLAAELAPGEEELQFWVSVLVFEEMGDYFNATIAADDRVEPLSRAINRVHHREESRHLAFGRAITREVFESNWPRWDAATRVRVRRYVEQFLIAEFRDYFNPAVYRDAGLADAYAVRERALASAAARARFEVVTARCVEVLMAAGIIEQRPAFDLEPLLAEKIGAPLPRLATDQ
jgi:hypothetical protein